MEQNANAAGDAQIPGRDSQFVHYKDLGAKFQSKNDMWTFLAVECDYYLPPKHAVTVYFLGDLMAGRKQRKYRAAVAADPLFAADIDNHSVKHLTVPHYESLSLHVIKDQWCGKAITAAHMPDPRDMDYLPRQWVINVCYTLHKEKFKKWVRELCEDRNKLRTLKAKEAVALDPVIHKAFKVSTLVARKCPPRQ